MPEYTIIANFRQKPTEKKRTSKLGIYAYSCKRTNFIKISVHFSPYNKNAE